MPEPLPDTHPQYALANMLGFARALRRSGLPVGSNQILEFVRALAWVDVADRESVYYAARATLVNHVAHLEILHKVFARYWKGAKPEADIPSRPPRGKGAMAEAEEAGLVRQRRQELGAAEEEGDHGEGEAHQVYSAAEALRQKDFAELTPEERHQLRWMIAELNLQLDERRSRRWRPTSGRRVDLRRSLRANLRQGSEWMEWIRRGPRTKPRPVVVLADISGSMESYTRVLLQFVYGLVRRADAPVEAFVFGTRLTRVTRQLEQDDPERALQRVSQAVPDWSGGTRIGQALRQFNTHWARRTLGRAALVMLVSDGWDRGEPEQLSQEMARLQRSSHRLIWLNPLLGAEGYQPLTRGMQAALPHVDDFLPVHNFDSLRALAEHLQQLDASQRSTQSTKRPLATLEGVQ